jgi:hypothetical protein
MQKCLSSWDTLVRLSLKSPGFKWANSTPPNLATVSVLLVLVCFTGCGQIAVPQLNPAPTSNSAPAKTTSNAPQPPSEQEFLSSWKRVVEQLNKNCTAFEAKQKEYYKKTFVGISMSNDLKKSDSLLSPYVGIIKIRMLWEFLPLDFTQTDEYEIEYAFSDGKWAPKQGSSKFRKQFTDGKQEVKETTYDEQGLKDPEGRPISRLLNLHKIR